ncbi:MAG TPA: hypothetical protein ENK18_02655 [Deltaproteobacteria bacterium]|nr:hypothetical protein [Deltaproteobacteria bacterium]
MTWWLALLACGGGVTGICRPGFVQGPDKHCYPPPPDDPAPSLTDALEHLPDCVPHKPAAEIDLDRGCAADACAGDTFVELDLSLGEDPDCEPLDGTDLLECTWRGEVAARFRGSGDRPDDGTRTDEIHLLSGYDGATAEGLGPDIAPRCFIEELGTPDLVVVEDVGGALFVSQMTYERYGLIVLDWLDEDGGPRADGIVDQLRLSGAPE